MLLSSTVNHGLFQTMDRLCGSTTNTYPLKAKIADLNEALDWYTEIAFKADGNWNFDDLNQTSPPIDTQNIVSGTNRYKFSAFTQDILNLLRLEILDSDGNGLSLYPETLDSFGNVVGNESGAIGTLKGSFDKVYINAPSGIPTHYIKYGDFIYLRPNPNYSEASGLKAYFNRAASKFSFVSCQPEADDDLITATGHGLVAGDTVVFEVDSSGTMPGNLTADTQYYVISSGLTSNVFKVSTTLGGSAVNISSDGTNVHFLKTSAEPGIVSVHHIALAQKASLQYLIYNSSPKTGVLPTLVAQSERKISDFFGRRDKDFNKRIAPVNQNNK